MIPHAGGTALPASVARIGGGDGNRTRVQGFADPCLNHSATPPGRVCTRRGAEVSPSPRQLRTETLTCRVASHVCPTSFTAVHESYATIWEAVADAVPGAPAAVQGDHRVTWRHLDDRASRLAAALTAAGVDRGTHVALYLFNCPEYAESVFACLKLRAVPANVNFRYGPAELEELLANADAEVLVYHRALSDRVATVLPLLPKLHTLVEIDDGEDVPGVDGALGYEHLIATLRARARASHAPATTTCSGTPVAPRVSRRA